MAAPQWTGGKCKSLGQVKAFFRHNDKDRRLEARHTNPHIDKALTPLNFSVKGLDYAGLCAAYDDRLGAVDVGRQSTGKNARTVLQSVVVYLPEGLTGADTATKARWFRRAGDILGDRFGDNFLDMQVDFDEIHEYTEPKTGEKKTAREHGHARLFPEVDGKLNGKAFSSREAITGLNTELQEMSLREFGVPMMDGSKAKGRNTVEQLKAQSRAAEIVQEAQKAAQRASEAIRRAAEAQAVQILKDAQKAADGLLEAARRVRPLSDRDEYVLSEARRVKASPDGRTFYQVASERYEKQKRLQDQERETAEQARKKAAAERAAFERSLAEEPSRARTTRETELSM